MPLSKSQLDQVGRRLRRSPEIAEEDRAAFVDYRAEFEPALREVQERVGRELGLAPGSRLKTLETVILKLRRQHIRLSQISDIAGCRVVVDTLIEQNAAIERLADIFPGADIRDYREKPQWGYRAVHLIVEAGDGRAVEIQVRTRMQNAWANISEAYAYGIDMAIKYGGGPSDVREHLNELSAVTHRLDTVRAGYREVANARDWIREVAEEDGSQSVPPEIEAVIKRLHASTALLDELGAETDRHVEEFEDIARTIAELMSGPQ